MGAGLKEDWSSDLTFAIVIPFGGRGGKGRCEQWGLAPPLFCRLGLINGAAHPVDQQPGRINGVGDPVVLPPGSDQWGYPPPVIIRPVGFFLKIRAWPPLGKLNSGQETSGYYPCPARHAGWRVKTYLATRTHTHTHTPCWPFQLCANAVK